VELTTSNPEIKSQTSVKVYPNPFSDYAIFELENNAVDARLVVYNLLGKDVMQMPFSGNMARINAAQLPLGIYVFNIEQKNGDRIGQGRIVRQ
jgi:Secretion system C-terminal sorting domain